MTLTAEQRAAAESTRPVTIVSAGPGSGKTLVLAARIAHLIQNCGVLPESIQALTFTRSACENIRRRVARSIGEELAARVFINTFHGYAFREIVKQEPEATVATEQEAEAALRSLYRGPTRRPRTRPITEVRRTIMWHEAGSLAPRWSESTPAIEDLNVIRRRLWAAKLIPTWDLLYALHDLRLAQQFDHVLVDEVQDCTSEEFDLAEQLAESGSLFLVGDPRQAIMGWRLALPWGFEPTHRLTKTFRFGRDIASVANEIAAHHGWDLIEAEGDDILCATDSTLVSILSEEGTRAVLCRTHRECEEVASQLGETAVHVRRRSDDALSSDCDRYEEIAQSGKIAVTTVHAAKGREWDAVVVNLPLNGEGEEARVDYVAVTRAKKRLLLCRGIFA